MFMAGFEPIPDLEKKLRESASHPYLKKNLMAFRKAKI